MKDIFQKYKRHSLITHLGIFSLSVFFALGINLLLQGNIDSDLLKASTIGISNDTELVNSNADLFATFTDSSIVIQNTAAMQDVSEISFTVTYDPDILEIEIPNSSSPDITYTTIDNTPGLETIIINFKSSLDIESETEIFKVLYTKLNDKVAQVNLINTNFTDSVGEKYLLSSQGAIN
ncbi:hypothetical protein GW846_02465 [Candidatus Gracilibacteria bacterium]|nr:hypothetical protein [Candidatus Gracilibacteria bacterium]